jgi:predicted aldo/keto reductase-like oxidoreductase
MKYRGFGNTGVDVSVLGFGCMRLPEIKEGDTYRVNDEIAIPLLRRAYELGINYFDTAWGYCHSDGQRALGVAVKGFRDKVYLSTKLPLWNIEKPEEFWSLLMSALERIDTSYIDFYHLHSLTIKLWDKAKRLGILDKLIRAKSLGLIKHISFSFHDDPALMNEIVDTGVFETLTCQYNLLDRTNEKAMEYAAKKGLGIVVMGPLGGGNIVAGGDKILSKYESGAKSAQELAFKFVLGNPNVSCAISGMTCINELNENVAIAETACETSRDEWLKLITASDEISAISDLYCTGCGYCEVCPKGIKPAVTFNAYIKKHVWDLDDIAKKIISQFGEESYSGISPESCIECGKCAKMCPQKIDIPTRLKDSWSKLKGLL